MAFEGHVDFYGRLPEAAGSIFCGWSSPWHKNGDPVALTVRFEHGSVATFSDYFVTFYPREDLGDRGSGFVLFTKGKAAGLGEFVSLEIDFGGSEVEIVPTPRPPELAEDHLRSELRSLLHRVTIDAASAADGAWASVLGALCLPEVLSATSTSEWSDVSSPADARSQQIEEIRASELFDADFYRETYGDVAATAALIERFVDRECAEGRRPNAYFDSLWYQETNPEVAEQKLNPLYHYLKFGECEGRQPSIHFDPAWYRQRYGLAGNECVLAHYLRHRRSSLFAPIPEFDVQFYTDTYPDIAAAGIDPFEHYLNWGYREGRNPSASFNTIYYVQTHLRGDHSENPLIHFLKNRGSSHSYELIQAGATTTHREIRKYTAAGDDYEDFHPVCGLRKRAKVLAYYLPQFHPFPENDGWWGRGFTEWTNLPRGVPRFKGHYQPRVPRDLGFYNLSISETLHRQVELATASGLSGFVFYYYWFNRKRLLHVPLERLLSEPAIDFPFCLMWANENWTRRWDGSEKEILISQDYCLDDDDELIEDLARHFRDERYIRINGRPVFMIYRPSLIPDASKRIARWRGYWEDRFDMQPLMLMAQSFEDVDPRPYGLDGAIEFPPHKLTRELPDINSEVEYLDPDFCGRVYRYDDVVQASLQEMPPPFPLVKTVVPSWDNDARRQGHGVTLTGSTPLKYQDWLSEVINRAVATPVFGEALVCVNGWNEWCEGAYLEPDLHFGAAYLNATARAITGQASDRRELRLLLVGHDAFPSGAQINLAHMGRYLCRYFGLECEFLLLDGGELESEYRKIAPTMVAADPAQLAKRIREFRDRGFTRALVNTSAAAHVTTALTEVGIASVVLVHELPRLIKEKNLMVGVAAALRNARNIVFPTELARDAVLSAADSIADARCVILPQGCYKAITTSEEGAAAVRAELGVGKGEHLVLGIGYADLRKGFDLFLQLWRLLQGRKKRVHLCWIGGMDHNLRAWLSAEIGDATGTGTFHLVGHRSDIASFLSAASAFALTSREDPFPTVALEALAAGLPVFAFADTGGIPEMLKKHRIGCVVPNGDVPAMAREISNSLRRGISEADRQLREDTIRRHFDFRAYVAALLRLARPELIAVSIVVPNYNYARYLPGRLGTIFAQSYPVSEITVLDDASTDDSIAIIEKTAAAANREVAIVADATNSGSVFRQWRKAAALAKSEHLWIAEADDLAEPGFLAQMLPLLAADPNIKFAFCDSRTIDVDGAPVWPSYKPYYATVEPDALSRTQTFDGHDFVTRFLSVKNLVLNVSAVVWRREALLSALDACEVELADYKMAGDWRLYLEALAAPGARVAYEAAPLNIHRRHAQSVTHALDAERHLDEITRCHQFVRRTFPFAEPHDRQNRYLDEIREQLGGHPRRAKAGPPRMKRRRRFVQTAAE